MDPELANDPSARAIAADVATWYAATPPGDDERRRLLARLREGMEAQAHGQAHGQALPQAYLARRDRVHDRLHDPVHAVPRRAFRLVPLAAAAAIVILLAGVARRHDARAPLRGGGAQRSHPVAPAEQAVGFALHLPDAGIRQVSVAGDFNGWSPTALPMHRDPATGTWRARTRLVPGRHEYSFVVNGTRWIIDPLAPRTMAQEMGPANVIAVPGAL